MDDTRKYPSPGYGDKPEQSAPQTIGELAEYFALALNREPAVYATVFQQEVVLTPGEPVTHLIIPVTDSPEVCFFHVRLQAHPSDAPGTVSRYAINLEGLQGRARLTAHVLANGGVLIPGYVEDMPVMRKRRQPITVDLLGLTGEPRVIVQVFDMRRVSFAPQSLRARSESVDTGERPRLEPQTALRANA